MLFQGGDFKKILVFLIILLGAGFFVLPKILLAGSSGDVFVNEICWMGTEVSVNDEWLELKNNTTADIDLAGWTLNAQDGQPKINLSGLLPAGGFFLLERTDDTSVPGVVADQIYTGALGNTGEILELRDKENNLIDSVSAEGAWPAGDNASKKTMEKSASGWQTSANTGGTPKSANSEIASEPTEPICGNSIIETGEACDDGNTASNDGCSAICALETAVPGDTETPTENQNGAESGAGAGVKKIYRLGNVLISEFVSDPSDNETEWIEIFNNTNKAIDLSGWTIEDGSGAITKLAGELNNFFVITSPKGNLNNAGDLILLRDLSGDLIDQVAYGNWNNSGANNAPAGNDPNSVARKIDNYNTFNNANDFALTTTPTKGASNLITGLAQDSDVSPEERAQFDYSTEIIITEIFPDSKDSDEQNEFIELFNSGASEVDLTGWKLEDLSGKKFIIKNKIIKPKEYLVVYRPETKIALNNNSETVIFFPPLETKAAQVIEYKNALENQSYNLSKEVELPAGSSTSNANFGANWSWSETVTPGKANQVKVINQVPVVEFYCPSQALVNTPIIFDSSDTTDDNEKELKFYWDFGDGLTNILSNPEHTYFKVGAYTIKLTVSDAENKIIKERHINIVKELAEATTTVSGWSEEYSKPVILNEIMPSPLGADETSEWIEIYNQGDTRINLLNWKLDDSEGGSAPYNFSENLWLNPFEYLLVDRPTSRITLNNDFDAVRLFNQAELVDQTEYEDAPEGGAWARGQNGKWFWTGDPTPKEKNTISLSSGKEMENYDYSFVPGAKNSSGMIFEIPLEKIPEQTAGDKIITRGTVAVLPGIFASQYFYITGSAGVQVYSYKKDFPKLKIGDLVEVAGELSQINGEWRVKTKTAADIKVIDSGIALPPTPKTCAEIPDCQAGEFLSVTGEVVEQKGSSLFLDDGTDETLVYIKTATGINPKNYKPGDTVSVSGLLTRTASGARLMPRSPEDIVEKNSENKTDNQVLGEVSAESEWTLPARDKKMELFKYLLVIAGAVIVLLIGLLIKMRK